MKKKTLLERIIERLPFKSRILGLVFGRKVLQLSEVQLLLARLGYLAEGYQPGQLDELTRRALSIFQRIHKLDMTGTITTETIEALEAPRCGNQYLPDPSLLASDSVAPLNLMADLTRGCAYRNVTTLTYYIENTPSKGGLNPTDVRNAIDTAFQTWGREIPIKFEPAQAANNATLNLKWAKGDHGDGENYIFDNSVSLYGHAFPPPDCNEPFPGECHFNDHLTWGLKDDPESVVFDLETVALHEIGHLLGLKHSDDLNSIMIDSYMGERRELKGDALVSIQKLYGSA